MINKKVVLVIPSYEPTEILVELVKELKKKFKRIIVVDDGSKSIYQSIYKLLEEIEDVKILKHSVNLGKGRALKTAFNYYLNEFQSEYLGVVTLDSDGQHKTTDVELLSNELQKNPNRLIMGVRNFKLDYVPMKSKIGNLLTVKIMDFLCGIKTKDTQTGLRALGNEIIKKTLSIEGERFEYETNVLLETKELNIEINDIEIETVYFEGNKGTHFNPIKDSLKIYKIILKFILSGATSAIFDLFVFWLLQKISFGLLFSNLTARGISSIWNFILNKKIVFNSNEGLKTSLFKYYSLVIIMGLCSTGLIKLIVVNLNYGSATMVKIFVELFLFFISFSIQNRIIFKKKVA
ncbi:MAG: glycosyltransferase [Cetobacterium sp.]|uniref:glycosyltransferase n=1 Tax=Cetobacterium sp. TaxID=2071632 RepID=UPI003F417E6A